MNCLRDYIGIPGCGATAPPSGLYINTLPGISFKQFAKLTSEDQATVADVWSDIQTRAIQRFELDVRSAFAKRYKLASPTRSYALRKIDPSTQTPAAGGAAQAGFTIELWDESDDFVQSSLNGIHIQQLFLYKNAADVGEVITINVTDLDLGTVLFTTTYTVSGASGWTTIEVNETFFASFASRPLRVYVSASNQTTLSTVMVEIPDTFDCWECCAARVRGAYGTYDNPTFGTLSYNLAGIFSVVCKYDAVVCQNKEVFKTAFWYLLGIETLNEQLNSDRLNSYTTVALNKASLLRAEYEVRYWGGAINDISIEGALKQAVDGINLNLSDCCLECNSAYKVVESNSFYG